MTFIEHPIPDGPADEAEGEVVDLEEAEEESERLANES